MNVMSKSIVPNANDDRTKIVHFPNRIPIQLCDADNRPNTHMHARTHTHNQPTVMFDIKLVAFVYAIYNTKRRTHTTIAVETKSNHEEEDNVPII